MSLPAVLTLDTPDDLPSADRVWFEPHRDAAGRFFNPWGAKNERGFFDVLKWKLGGQSEFAEARYKDPNIPVAARPREVLSSLEAGGRVMWLGHASLLVEIDGVTALIDPVFGRAGPVPRLAPTPLGVDDLPQVDVVLLSHGHRDHLDAASLKALAKRFGPELLWVTPLGLGRALPGGAKRVVELDWWQQVDLRGVAVSFVPSQHWHQRTPLDRNQALWGGWVLSGSRSVYHSGDTGYFDGFAAIGRVFPDIDLAVLPLGAYEPRWFMSQQHMSPESSVQAFLDLGAQRFLGMHWGTFNLTDEPADHGAYTLLPDIVRERGLEAERFVVVKHGGGVSLGGEVLEAASVH
ncbi:MAG: MBL fold metallo-hydrolase [Alphaproteobacteria bacterium]|nr:MBL fold metallo-hydrolase [Alphaproteobacteria bacterium]